MTPVSRRTILKSTLPGALATIAVLDAADTANAKDANKPMPKKDAMIKDGFTIKNSIIMLVDHQTGTVGWVKSIPKETVIAGCRVLSKMAVAYKIPLIITTTMEQIVGVTVPDIQQIAPEAFANRYARGGALDCWSDEKLRAGVAALGRKKIIIAGLTTDICLYWAASTALKLGYEVLVVADACGTTSSQGDEMTYARLRKAGAEISVVNQVVTELANDFGVPEGAAAQQIMADEVISKL